MLKLLFIFIQKPSGCLQKQTLSAMSKRSTFNKTPRFRPEVKLVNKQAKQSTMFSRKEKVEVLSQPIKSTSDKKLYKTIRLENGLTALLISDPSRLENQDSSSSEEDTSGTDGTTGPESDSGKSGQSASSDQHGNKRREFDEEKLSTRYKRNVLKAFKSTYKRLHRKRCKLCVVQLSLDTAACALCVGVGSYSDPPDIQGLAHFVEHMVFMGSEKYPKENQFDSFIKKKGGSDNAATDCEMTTFYFEIQEKYLPQAMDMFSQFFVSPLMLKEAMQREREAIESEFAIAKPSDSNRKDQLLSSLFPEGHPARLFSWGNLRSLKDNVTDDRLYSAAHEFRRRHYSANRMTVAVQARMELPSLEQYVVSTFGRVPTNKLPADDFEPYRYDPHVVAPHFNSIYYVKPVSDITELHLTWVMRSLISEYESKPHQYVSFLLGHEGKGSLLSYLRKKVWALSIYTGNSESGIDYTSMYSLFSTQIVLTQEGLDHVDEVLEALFSYLNMLRKIGPSERIFEEIKSIEENSFRFEEESQPSEYVESLVENMHYFPPEHYLTGDKLYYKYDPKGITELLECMRADTMNVMILSNKHTRPVQYDQQETWFGTDYKREEIPQDWMQKWSTVDVYSNFYLPAKNVYITTNFELVPPAQPYVDAAHELEVNLTTTTLKDLHRKSLTSSKLTKVLRKDELIATINDFRLDQPNLLRKNRHMELWYKPDFKFRFPTALLYFYFITPLSLRSPKDSCMLDLWTDVMHHGLKEEVYPANMADLQHNLYVGDKGLTLKVTGYNQNLHLVVSLVTRLMPVVTDELEPALFEAVRDVRARSYHNLLLKPTKLAKDIRMDILLQPYISPRDKAAVIHDITLEDLKDFSKKLLSTLYLQVLMQGNLHWYEAMRISDSVLDNLQWKVLAEEELPEVSVHEVPLGSRVVRVRSLNPASTNSIVANYYQAGAATDHHTAVLELIMMLMEEPVFDFLRTKEQLGYSVFSIMRYTFGVLGFSVTVNTQADKFSVCHVDSRVEAFLKKFTRDLRRLSERALGAARRALVQIKHTTDYELKEEVDRNWKEIVSMEYQFQKLYTEAEAVQRVTLSDIKTWIADYFPTGNQSKFRKLSVQVIGHKPTNVTEEALPREPSNNYELTYVEECDVVEAGSEAQGGGGAPVSDVRAFGAALPTVPVQRVRLQTC